MGFQYDLIKYHLKEDKISLIQSPDWDSSEEPLVGDSILWKKGGETTHRISSLNQIYHHKWLFVDDHYQGFDRLDSMMRSLEWVDLECDRSKIGNLQYWQEEVIDKYGLPFKNKMISTPLSYCGDSLHFQNR